MEGFQLLITTGLGRTSYQQTGLKNLWLIESEIALAYGF
jgi:hypothetical protein